MLRSRKLVVGAITVAGRGGHRRAAISLGADDPDHLDPEPPDPDRPDPDRPDPDRLDPEPPEPDGALAPERLWNVDDHVVPDQQHAAAEHLELDTGP